MFYQNFYFLLMQLNRYTVLNNSLQEIIFTLVICFDGKIHMFDQISKRNNAACEFISI